MIDTGAELDRINIKELTLPEPIIKEGVRFDPKRDIKTEDWEGILDLIRIYSDPEDESQTALMDLLPIASSLKIISPERIPDTLQEPMYEQRVEREMSKQWDSDDIAPATITMSIKSAGILYPQISRDKLMNHVQEENLKANIQGKIDGANVAGDPNCFQALHSLADLKVFDPHLLTQFENIDKIVEMAKVVCEDHLDKFSNETYDDADILQFLRFAPQLKMLAPEKFKELNITNDHWKNLKKYMEYEKEDSGLYLYITQATQLSIISATNLHFSNKSLQLVFDDKTDLRDNAPIPEVRKF